MNSWPMQAALICAGRYAELRRLQLELTSSHPFDAASNNENSLHHRFHRNEPAFQVSALGLVLMCLAIVLLILGKMFNWCAIENTKVACAVDCPVVVEPRIEKTIVLNANLLFDYNKAVPYTPEHEKAFDQTLREEFQGRADITVTKIVAHTDPIGSDAFNRDLARGRGQYVREALNRLANRKDIKFTTGQIPDAVVVPDDSASAVDHDSRFWKACYDMFYTNDPDYRPLLDLDKSVLGGRPLCSAGKSPLPENGTSPYPGCRAPIADDLKSSARVAYQRLDKFRDIASCLAPMRHVLVTFSSSASAQQR